MDLVALLSLLGLLREPAPGALSVVPVHEEQESLEQVLFHQEALE